MIVALGWCMENYTNTQHQLPRSSKDEMSDYCNTTNHHDMLLS